MIGAIIYFTGVDESLVSNGLDTVGLILMLGGALALIMGLIMNAQRTRTQHTTVTERRGAPDVVERRVDDPDYVERRVERRDDVV